MAEMGGDRQQLGRLSDRLRGMTEPALTRPRAELEGRSVAATVHDLCMWAARAMGIDAPVPVLHALASGDQLTVIGREFLDWCETTEDAVALSHWRAQIGSLRSAT